MAEKIPQTKENHVKFDPLFHYFLAPGLLITICWAVAHLVRHRDGTAGLILLLAIFLFFTAFKTRVYSLKVQDRVIRLEERLRLSMLLNEPLRSRIPELTERQLIALRFATDAEVAGLVDRCLKENLDGKQIKNAIQTWRPDYWRV